MSRQPKRRSHDWLWPLQKELKDDPPNDNAHFVNLDNRLTTFARWIPVLRDAYAKTFAIHGFISAGQGDIVICFHCKSTVSGQDLVQQAFDGTEHFHDCPFHQE